MEETFKIKANSNGLEITKIMKNGRKQKLKLTLEQMKNLIAALNGFLEDNE